MGVFGRKSAERNGSRVTMPPTHAILTRYLSALALTSAMSCAALVSVEDGRADSSADGSAPVSDAVLVRDASDACTGDGASLADAPAFLPGQLVPDERAPVVRLGIDEGAVGAMRRDGRIASWRYSVRTGDEPDRWGASRLVTGVPAGLVDADVLGDVGTGSMPDGSVVAWGRPTANQWPSRNGQAEALGGPYRTDGIPSVRKLFRGGQRSYLYTRAGDLWYWGLREDGDYYRGRNPRPDDFVAPRPVVHTGPILSMCGGGLGSTCVARGDGHVVCWGMNLERFVLPTGDYQAPPRTETVIPGIDDALQVECHDRQVCALRRSGAVACWGAPETQSDPASAFFQVQGVTPIAALDRAIHLAVGYDHICVVRYDHRVRCLGGNDSVQGVDALTDVVSVHAGRNVSCALRRNGEVWCWGRILPPIGGPPGVSPPVRVAVSAEHAAPVGYRGGGGAVKFSTHFFDPP